MRFAFTDEQQHLRDALREMLGRACPPEAVRSAWENERGRVDGLWLQLVEMGIVGLTTPEAQGGLGLGPLDLVLLLEETGRFAVPEPLVETIAVAAPLLEAVGRADLLDGRACFTWADGPDRPIPAAGTADLILVRYGDELHGLPPDVTALEATPSVDRSRRTARLVRPLDNSSLLARDVDEALDTAADRGALGAAAQLLGLSAAMIERTVEHVTTRKQFGQPIGSFQAVKHHLADARLALEFARPLVYRAAWSAQTGHAEAGRHASMAKAFASDAAQTVSEKALQCHGAIGYSFEYDLHLWMKRAWALGRAFGDARWHRRRLADALLGPHPEGH